MLFPEFLYRLSERDLQVTWLDPRLAQASASVAAAGVTATLATVPLGQAMIVTSAAVRGIGGAGQSVVELALLAVDLGGNQFAIAGGPRESNNQARHWLNWSGQIIIPQSWTFAANGQFTAGVNANTVDIWIAGMLVPIGNIQRV